MVVDVVLLVVAVVVVVVVFVVVVVASICFTGLYFGRGHTFIYPYTNEVFPIFRVLHFHCCDCSGTHVRGLFRKDSIVVMKEVSSRPDRSIKVSTGWNPPQHPHYQIKP